MNIVGIISEFNPLHNGHQYMMKKAKELTDAQYVVLVMSGNYVQRGLPAFLEKDFRVKAALSAGADMVIELPIPFATGSAEYFASAGVAILHQLGFVTHLAFGSEEGRIEPLQEVSGLLEIEETSEYKDLLKSLLSNGMIYAKAREEALQQLTGSKLHDVLSKPNNALGLSYLQALKKQQSSITAVTVKRIGKAYDDYTLSRTGFSSAGGIRTQVANGKIDTVLSSIPDSSRDDFRLLMDNHYNLDEDAFSLPLLTMLQQADKDTLLSYFDVTPALADKLMKLRLEHYLYSDLANACKSKEITHAHITRALLHIMLGITKEEVAERAGMKFSPYAYVLGYRNDASDLFKMIKKNSSIPVIVRVSDGENLLDQTALSYFEKDLRRDALYHSVLKNQIRPTKKTSTLWTYEGPTGKPATMGTLNPYTRQVICV